MKLFNINLFSEYFLKYPFLQISEEKLKELQNEPFSKRLEFLESYKNKILLYKEFKIKNAINYSKFPFIAYQLLNIVFYKNYLYPEDFLFKKKDRSGHIKYYVKVICSHCKKELKKDLYKFLKGNGCLCQRKVPRLSAGARLSPNSNEKLKEIQNCLDEVFPKGEVVVNKYLDNYLYEFICNKKDCKNKTPTCNVWAAKSTTTIFYCKKSEECSKIHLKECQHISEEYVKNLLKEKYNEDIILVNYKGFYEKAAFQCNRSYCKNFNNCSCKTWEVSCFMIFDEIGIFPKKGCIYKKKSFGEYHIERFLIKNNILYSTYKRFLGCKNIHPLFFDFYLPEYNLCIEYQGAQHYKPVERFGGEKSFKKNQLRDQIKKDYCSENEIFLLEIPYTIRSKEDIESYITYILNNMKEGVFNYDISDWRSSRGY